MTEKDLEIRVLGESLVLIGEKAIYWPEKESLIVSDLHLGKAGHFRKNGIPIPSAVHQHDLDRLNDLVENCAVKRVIFLGDLFHSDYNLEWQDFLSWVDTYPNVEFILVKGNHDVMPDQHYLSGNLSITECFESGPFSFTHHQTDTELYNLSGHVHPCVKLVGPGKQGLRVPCFYFSQNHGILPAFGNFTGSHPIRPKVTDQVYGVINRGVIDLVNQKRSILSK